MPRYNVIRDSDGLVVNTVMLALSSGWSPPEGHSVRLAPVNGSPGDTWNGSRYVPAPVAPDPRLRTRAMYRLEFQNPETTEERRQEIRDIVVGLRAPEPAAPDEVLVPDEPAP